MVVLLPRKVDGLRALERDLTDQHVSQWLGDLFNRDVNVHLPRFKMESEFQLSGVLKSMGMPDAFDNFKSDFSGMVDGLPPYWAHIDNVIHKAFVDVNEEGTEAAAATVVTMGFHVAVVPPPPPPPMEFRADHPFIFLLRQQSSGAILFMGRVANPKV
jgi:serpin B